MHKMTITSQMYKNAEAAAEKLGVLKGSIRRGQGNIYGMLGEEIFQELFPQAVRVSAEETSHDFEIEKLRIDVKTKMTSYVPKPEYEGSVTKLPKQQDCDIYFFCRVHQNTRYGWVCGWEFSSSYMRNAYLKKKGDRDPSNGNVCKRTCWNMYYKDMLPLGALQKLTEELNG